MTLRGERERLCEGELISIRQIAILRRHLCCYQLIALISEALFFYEGENVGLARWAKQAEMANCVVFAQLAGEVADQRLVLLRLV